MSLKEIIFLLIFCTGYSNSHLLEGLYCGKENCYDVLGVTRDSSKSDIAKNYRALAKVWHPDRHRDESKIEATEKFKSIATAYEILRDDQAREDYNYMLDHPEEYYAHYYRYYRRRVAPKVDVRIVVIVTISIISAIQYYSKKQRYVSAIDYFINVPKYRNKAIEMLHEEKLLQDTKNHKKAKSKMSKAEQKEEQERLIRQVIEEKMDIKGCYSKPTMFDILWVQIAIFPYTFTKYLIWYFKWIYNFNILKKPFGEEEKLYLIRKNLGIGEHQFNAIEDHTIADYLNRKLWMKENFVAWKAEQEEEMKKQMADNPRYKSYRRYLRKGGPGRLTFED